MPDDPVSTPSKNTGRTRRLHRPRQPGRPADGCADGHRHRGGEKRARGERGGLKNHSPTSLTPPPSLLSQLFTEYAAYADAGGLRRDGLIAAYADGLGDAAADLATLGLSPDRTSARAAAADLASVAALAIVEPASPALAAAYAAATPPPAAWAELARAQRRHAARVPLSPPRRVPVAVSEVGTPVAAELPAELPPPPPTTGGWSRATARASPPPDDVSDGDVGSPPQQPFDTYAPQTTPAAARHPPTTPGSLRRPRSAADPYATPPPHASAHLPADPDACVTTLLARGAADAAAGRLADAARAYGSATKLARGAARGGDTTAAPQLAARAALRLGNTLFGMGQPDAAEAAYVEGLEALGDDAAEAAYVEGLEALGDDAAKPGAGVCTLPPSDVSRLLPKLRLNLGIALEAQGRLAAAAAAYAGAVTAAPRSAPAHKLRGSALFALGRAETAAASLRRALELDPGYADAHVDLGCTLCALGDSAGAAASFSAALRLDGGHVEALFNLASLRRQTGDWAGAVSGYDRVLAVDPGHWRAHLGRAVALTGARRDDDAKAAFASALELAGVAQDALADEVERLRAAAAAPAPSRASLADAMARVSARAAAVVAGQGGVVM